ncbi:MAG: AAA family ATPase [Enterobacteriaceae bacterium]
MKIAISGKGGVGKTTFAGTLCRILTEQGQRVLAIDADPDANLASALGFSAESLRQLQPLAKMKSLARERTGAEEGYGGLFRLNPRVDDIVETFAVREHGVALLQLGTIEVGGSGCVCPEHALVRSLLRHLLLQNDESLVLDMEAGIEHLGRATAEATDALIVVLEPGKRSLQTASAIEKLAADIGISRVLYVANKVQDAAEEHYLQQALQGRELLGIIRFSSAVKQADMAGLPLYGQVAESTAQIRAIVQRLLALI